MLDCFVTVIIGCHTASSADGHAVPRTSVATGWLVQALLMATRPQAMLHTQGVEQLQQLPTAVTCAKPCIALAGTDSTRSSSQVQQHGFSAIMALIAVALCQGGDGPSLLMLIACCVEPPCQGNVSCVHSKHKLLASKHLVFGGVCQDLSSLALIWQSLICYVS